MLDSGLDRWAAEGRLDCSSGSAGRRGRAHYRVARRHGDDPRRMEDWLS